MKVYIGIDGGGTKTRAVAATANGDLLVDAVTAGTNVNRYGWESAQAVLSNLFLNIRSQLPENAKVSAVYLGMSGIDREPERLRMSAWVKEQFPDAMVGVENDALPALASGSGQSIGIVLIAGTGSIAFGINEAGERCRVGGWGYLIGDEGSGYDIGKQALAAVLKSYDGRNPETLLTQKILQQYGLKEPEELIPLVYSETFSREKMAGIAGVVLTAAEEGDPVSLALLSKAAGELCQLVEVLLNRLPFARQKVSVVLTGGLFHKGSMLNEMVRTKLGPNLEVAVSEQPPVVGALRLAQRLSGDVLSASFESMLNEIR